MSRRRPSAQFDLFAYQGDLFVWANTAEEALWRKASHPLPPAEITPLRLLGEAVLKAGRKYNDPGMELNAMRLLGRKPH